VHRKPNYLNTADQGFEKQSDLASHGRSLVSSTTARNPG